MRLELNITSIWPTIDPNKENFWAKIVIIFLPISLNICFGAQKNRLIETVLLSTHNICFRWEIKKNLIRTLIWRPG